ETVHPAELKLSWRPTRNHRGAPSSTPPRVLLRNGSSQSSHPRHRSIAALPLKMTPRPCMMWADQVETPGFRIWQERRARRSRQTIGNSKEELLCLRLRNLLFVWTIGPELSGKSAEHWL